MLDWLQKSSEKPPASNTQGQSVQVGRLTIKPQIASNEGQELYCFLLLLFQKTKQKNEEK